MLYTSSDPDVDHVAQGAGEQLAGAVPGQVLQQLSVQACPRQALPAVEHARLLHTPARLGQHVPHTHNTVTATVTTWGNMDTNK